MLLLFLSTLSLTLSRTRAHIHPHAHTYTHTHTLNVKHLHLSPCRSILPIDTIVSSNITLDGLHDALFTYCQTSTVPPPCRIHRPTALPHPLELATSDTLSYLPTHVNASRPSRRKRLWACSAQTTSFTRRRAPQESPPLHLRRRAMERSLAQPPLQDPSRSSRSSSTRSPPPLAR